MAKMLQSWIGRAVLATVAAAVAILATFAVTGGDADAQSDGLQPATQPEEQDDEPQAGTPPLKFTQEIGDIASRKGEPILPIVLPAATGGEGHLSYNIDHLNQGERKQGPPAGFVFNETTRRLSGRPSGDPAWYWLYYSVSDISGRIKEASFTLAVNGPTPQRLPLAIAQPELGTLDRGLIRCGVWSEESFSANFEGGFSGWFEIYTFHLASPSQLTIDLESDEADTEMILVSPTRSSADKGWRDDNGGQDTNSRLTLDLAPARYTITVTTTALEDEIEGAPYTLRIRSPDFPAGNADANRNCPEDSAGRIVARRLDDGRTEFAWHVEDGDRVLPRRRYLPSNPPRGRWLNSSEIIVDGVNLGRINVRVDAETGRIEFAFTPTGGDRILPPSRYFPSDAAPGRWLRSTLIEPGG